MRRMFRSEAGTAAVEFALVLPILITLVLGIVEYGRLYNLQISLSNAAREAARTMVVTGSATQAQNAAIAGAPALSPALSAANISGLTTCPLPGGTPTTESVTITYSVTSITGFFFSTLTLQGRGAMLCNN